MEADWEFEISSDAPVIDAHWQGYVDLSAHPERAADLPEAISLPALAEMLTRLNSPSSRMWTSKCDVWQVDPNAEQLDPDELDSPLGMPTAACACYIDLLSRSRERWANPDDLAQDCRALCTHLRSVELRCCRADLVIRRAVLADGETKSAVTAYLTACGSSDEAARQVLAQALHAFADSLLSAWEH
jgi:hypothetical protein